MFRNEKTSNLSFFYLSLSHLRYTQSQEGRFHCISKRAFANYDNSLTFKFEFSLTMKVLSVLSFLALTATTMAQVSYNNKDHSTMQRTLKTDERTLAAVQDHHDRRMDKLREMIQDRRQSVDDHNAGRRRLSEEDYDRTSRQLHNFQRKLAYMEETNSKEHHMERISEMQSLEDPNRLDNMAVREAMGKFNK
ncbi:hypothetical protein IV203_028793 [Nitzschia inconspicua]|uniref:Uncharacterized protein n=1 Tax=Nitzschia inconspicua TaxID=303405 RepID=A0A9K3LQI1_9STRA|nr:hypothetical protein IV203_028793 [Nitzschia inconspicua]